MPKTLTFTNPTAAIKLESWLADSDYVVDYAYADFDAVGRIVVSLDPNISVAAINSLGDVRSDLIIGTFRLLNATSLGMFQLNTDAFPVAAGEVIYCAFSAAISRCVLYLSPAVNIPI